MVDIQKKKRGKKRRKTNFSILGGTAFGTAVAVGPSFLLSVTSKYILISREVYKDGICRYYK